MVVVPQSADTLFKIGFKKVAGIPEDIGSDSVLVFQPSGKGSGLSCCEFSEKFIGKGKVYGRISTDKSLIQHGGEDLVVISAQTEAVFDTAYSIAQVEPQIPQREEDLIHEFLCEKRDLWSKEDQYINVRVDTKLFSAITSHSHQGKRMLFFEEFLSNPALLKALPEILVKDLSMIILKTFLSISRREPGEKSFP